MITLESIKQAIREGRTLKPAAYALVIGARLVPNDDVFSATQKASTALYLARR